MKSLIAFALLVAASPGSLFACGGYGSPPHAPSLIAEIGSGGAIVACSHQVEHHLAKAGLLRLKQLDQATDATIFCQLEDGSELDVLETEKSPATDKQVEHLQLDLLTSEKVDAMLDEAVKLPHLKAITVNFCWGGAGSLSKQQVEKLAQCQNLETLKLTKTAIAAGDLAPLNEAPKLRELVLDQKSNIPVEELEGIDSLRQVRSDQAFSEEQRKAMQSNLPNCEVLDPSTAVQGG